MDRRYRRPLSRSAVFAVVLGGHVLLVLLLAGSKHGDGRSEKTIPHGSILVLLDLGLPEPMELPPDAKKPELIPEESDSPNKSRTAARPASPERATAPSAADDISRTTIDAARIDWQGEAQRAAKAMAPALQKQQQRDCEEAK